MASASSRIPIRYHFWSTFIGSATMNLVYIQSGSILLQARNGHQLVKVLIKPVLDHYHISTLPVTAVRVKRIKSCKVFKEWAILILCAMHALFPLILRFSFTKYHSQKFNFEL